MKKAIHVLAACLILAVSLVAQQNNPLSTANQIQLNQSIQYTTPVTATAAAGSPAVLTISAVQGQYIYLCGTLSLTASNNNTGAVLTNLVTTSTNLNSFALKFSQISANSNSYDWSMPLGNPGTGCVKSTSPSTATTLTSPTTANWAYVWVGSFYYGQ